MNIELRIDELVLIDTTLPAGSEAQLRSSLQRDLARLLSTEGPSARLIDAGHVPHLVISDVRLTSTTTPAPLSRDLSTALHQGLTR